MEIRSLRSAEAHEARGLLEDAFARTPYGASPRLALNRALEAESDESLALGACDGPRLVGLVLYGMVAGSRGAAKLHAVAVTAAARLRGVAAHMIDAAADALVRRGARLVVAEAPDDPVMRPGLALLERSGFAVEGRVGDFYRDRVDLLLLRRDL
jgi:ribosomal protein S18 acetylase RimI-like enzyme